MLKKVSLAVGVVLTVFILFAIWDTRNTEKHAESFLTEWNHIRLGDDPEQTRLMSQQFGARYSSPSQECNTAICDYDFGFHNVWIARFHLAPKRVFGGRVAIRDNRIVYKELLFAQGNDQALARVSDVNCYPCELASRSFDVSVNGFKSLVTLTPASTADERALSYQFNLKFLTSLRRFKNERDLQPALMEYVDRQIEQRKL